jgi:hypothetical protein
MKCPQSWRLFVVAGFAAQPAERTGLLKRIEVRQKDMDNQIQHIM